MRSDGVGESHKRRNFSLFDYITPVGQERRWHFPSLIEQHFPPYHAQDTPHPFHRESASHAQNQCANEVLDAQVRRQRMKFW